MIVAHPIFWPHQLESFEGSSLSYGECCQHWIRLVGATLVLHRHPDQPHLFSWVWIPFFLQLFITVRVLCQEGLNPPLLCCGLFSPLASSFCLTILRQLLSLPGRLPGAGATAGIFKSRKGCKRHCPFPPGTRVLSLVSVSDSNGETGL